MTVVTSYWPMLVLITKAWAGAAAIATLVAAVAVKVRAVAVNLLNIISFMLRMNRTEIHQGRC